MHNNILPLAIFIIGIIIIQHFNRKAQSKLSVEEKASLMDVTSGIAVWRLIPLVCIMIGYGAFTYFHPSFSGIKVALFIYLMLILISSIISNLIIQKKYREIGLHADYIRTTAISSFASILMMIIFFAWIMYPLLKMKF